MVPLNGSMTRASLLWRVRNPADQKAWEEFVDRYAPRIYNWCRARGLQDADCEEIGQEVLVKLVSHMQRFKYDAARGSYRGWLKTVTNHAISDVANKRQPSPGGDHSLYESISAIEARQSLEDQLAEDFDLEIQAEAMRRVKSRVEPQTWTVFERRTFERHPASKVAEDLSMSTAAVNMANHRVKALLRAAVQELESGNDGPKAT